jgi:RNase P protein component
MKRRLREAVRLHGMVSLPVDVVINPKKSLLKAEFLHLREEVDKAFRSITQKLGEPGVRT